MPIQVQGPDGQLLEFPDGTPRETMKAAMAKRYGAPKQRPAASAKPREPAAATYNLTGVPGVSTQVGGFLDAAQHHGMNVLHGTAQLVEHGVNAAANALLPAPQQTLSSLVTGQRPQAHGLARVRQAINDTVSADDAALAKREADYQNRTRGNALSYAGAAVGEIAPWMAGIGQLKAAGLLPTITATGAKGAAQKGGLLALEGAAMGAAQPVTEGDYGQQKALQVGSGAVTAPVIGGTLAAGGATARGAGRLARYATDSGRDKIAAERLAKLYGSGPEVVARLERAGSGVPGVQPTVAQALATPEAIQAERVLRNNGASAASFAMRESQNNAALRNEAQRLAGTDTDMAAAKAARKEATDPYYASLPGKKVAAAPVMAALDKLEGTGLATNQKVKAAIGSLREELKSRVGPDGTIDADVLSGLHENVGSHLGPMASGKEKVALGPIKAAIVDALDAAVPGYRANLAAYGTASRTIRDMEAGRALLSAIDSGGRDAGGNQAVTLNHLKSLIAKDNRARYPMSAEVRARVERMIEALQQRSVTNNTIAATGPGTAADTMRGFATSPMGARLLSLLAGGGGMAVGGLPGLLAGGALSEGLSAANASVLRKLGAKGADAKLAAVTLRAQQALGANKQPPPLLRLLLPYEQRALPPPTSGGR